MNKQPNICVVGWYFFESFYKELGKSNFKIHIVAHRNNEVLNSLNHTLTDNVGLEYGAYSYYVRNIWDEKSDVFFMHDDVNVADFDSVISKCYKEMKAKDVGHGRITSGKHAGYSQRFFYMSSSFIKIVKERYDGMWYDRENFGYIDQKSQPEDWRPRRYNDGAFHFSEMIKEINKDCGLLICYDVIDERIDLYDKGSAKIKPVLTKKEKQEKKKRSKYLKQRKKEEIALWKKKRKK